MYSTKSILWLAIIVTVVLFSNCSETTEPENSIGELIPLKVGNSWDYLFTFYDSTGSIIYTENQTSTIIKDTIISNYKWYHFNDDPDGIWFTNKSDGYWAFIQANTGSIINDTYTFVYKYPTEVGDIYSDSYGLKEVVATNKLLTVTAGTFNVIHIVRTFPDTISYLMDNSESFIAPQVGIIKTMQFGRKPDGNKFIVGKRELENYTLK